MARRTAAVSGGTATTASAASLRASRMEPRDRARDGGGLQEDEHERERPRGVEPRPEAAAERAQRDGERGGLRDEQREEVAALDDGAAGPVLDEVDEQDLHRRRDRRQRDDEPLAPGEARPAEGGAED